MEQTTNLNGSTLYCADEFMQRKLNCASELIREATVENKYLKEQLDNLLLENDRLRL